MFEQIGILLSFIFGTILGSFLNVVILRLPKDQSLTGRSQCPDCSNTLGFLDLFPVLSFLFLKGKCRHCHKKISPRYFIIELVTGLLFALSFWYLHPTDSVGILQLFRWWFFEAVLITVFVIDLEHYLILDKIVFPGVAILLIMNLALGQMLGHSIFYLHSYFVSGLIGAAALTILFFATWYFSEGRALGFGDVKLAIFLGLALGWPLVGIGLLLSVFLGALVGIGLLIFSNKNLKSRLPFGTFLSVGSILTLFYGEKLLTWYLALLGL
jgi:leader peptidase (prepilin peptidase)/N-methyltransferase